MILNMGNSNILQVINEQMRGIWYDQNNRVWQFLPEADGAGTLLFDDKKLKYRFIDNKEPKLDVEYQATYRYTSLFNGCEIHLEKNKQEFAYLSRKKLITELAALI